FSKRGRLVPQTQKPDAKSLRYARLFAGPKLLELRFLSPSAADCLTKPPVARIFAPVSPRTQASWGKTHTKIVPPRERFSVPFAPVQVSGKPQPRSREYGGAALCLTSTSIRRVRI